MSVGGAEGLADARGGAFSSRSARRRPRNYARLNHILIPSTKEGRDRFRNTRLARFVIGPISRTWFSLTEAGIGLVLLSFVSSLLGLDVIRGQNYLLWSVIFSLLVSSLLLRFLFDLKGVEIRVEGPLRVGVGVEAEFRVHVENQGDRVHRDLQIRRPFLPWDGRFTDEGPQIDEVRPGQLETVSTRARFVARGHHHLDAFAVGALLPLGLAVGPRRESRGTRFVVVPRIAPISRIELAERARPVPGGTRMAAMRGDSMELVGLRPYRQGDRIRDLHAASWARLGVPMVREYQEEYFSRIGVVLDCHAAASDEARFEAMVSLAGGIVDYLRQRDAVVDLLTPGGPEGVVSLGPGLGSLELALDRLADVEARGEDDALEAEPALELLAPTLEHLSALVVVMPAWDGERRWLRRRIAEYGAPSRVLVVCEHDEAPIGMEPGLGFIQVEDIERACDRGEALSL